MSWFTRNMSPAVIEALNKPDFQNLRKSDRARRSADIQPFMADLSAMSIGASGSHQEPNGPRAGFAKSAAEIGLSGDQPVRKYDPASNSTPPGFDPTNSKESANDHVKMMAELAATFSALKAAFEAMVAQTEASRAESDRQAYVGRPNPSPEKPAPHPKDGPHGLQKSDKAPARKTETVKIQKNVEPFDLTDVGSLIRRGIVVVK